MEVYTIGHTNYKTEYFIELLKKYDINCIIDVRSTPFSKFVPQFNKDIIKKELNKSGIYYIHMGKEFGARREKKELYNDAGYVDFEKTRKDEDFLSGVKRIEDGLKKGFRIALMCTEKDAFDCHRSILVSKGLRDNAIQVNHILSEDEVETQDDIEKRLLDKFFSNRFQISIDSLMGKQKSAEEMIEEGYRKRNKEIGYQINLFI